MRIKPRVLLILILIIAAFFRFYKLDTLPPGLHPDEAANGLDIIRMMDNHDFRVFYNTNGPREALFFYLQGIFVLLLGFTQLALRIAPAIIGVLTVWGLYLLSKEWLDKNTALLATFFLAVSSWHVQFSRNGFRAIMTPLILVFLFYFLTEAVREKKRIYFILTGAFFALGFYTYLAYIMILPIIFFFIIYLLISKKLEFLEFLNSQQHNIIISLMAAAIIYLPMATHLFYHPGDFLARAGGVSILNSEFGNPIQSLVKNTAKALLMFNWAGDENYRHNYNGWPMLDPIVGIFFIIGFILTLFRLNQTPYFFAFLWFGFMLSPTILSAEGLPHSLRAVGVIPIVYILSALGFKSFYDYLSEKINLKEIAQFTLVAVLIFNLIYGYTRYFVLWANDPKIAQAYDSDISAMAKFLNTQPNNVEKYAVILGYSNHQLAFLTHDKNNHPIQGLYGISGNYHVINRVENLKKIWLSSDKYVFVIQETVLKEAKPILLNFFPDGKLKARDGFFYYTNFDAAKN